MKEQEQPRDEYWNTDEQIGEFTLWRGEVYALRLKAHIAEERYSQSSGEEIVPLKHQRGDRIYVHAKPYVLVPDIQLGVQLFPAPAPTGAIGAVTSSTRAGMRHEEVGECQAWYYLRDRVVILWEAFLHDPYRRENPVDDPNIAVLWDGFERFLIRRFPPARLIATTHDEPLYETDQYQEFLRSRGYRRLNQGAFGKRVRPAAVNTST